jgi:hypothetical protein
MGIKSINSNILRGLRAELHILLGLARTEAARVQPMAAAERHKALWVWWWSIRADVPSFFEVARRAVLILPSSAPVERFFSVLKGATSKQQGREDILTMERRGLELYNARQEGKKIA